MQGLLITVSCFFTKLFQDGRVICSSLPIYGEGKEAGNEAGYIVGMSSCYPRPGSVKISKGETLTLLSNYSCDQRHTGVMGLFYLLVAEMSRQSSSILHSKDNVRSCFMFFSEILKSFQVF